MDKMDLVELLFININLLELIIQEKRVPQASKMSIQQTNKKIKFVKYGKKAIERKIILVRMILDYKVKI